MVCGLVPFRLAWVTVPSVLAQYKWLASTATPCRSSRPSTMVCAPVPSGLASLIVPNPDIWLSPSSAQ